MALPAVEKPTLVERFVSLIPLPYPVAALVWAALVPASPGFLGIRYLVTGTPFLYATTLPNALLNLLLPLYLFLMVRYMRLRVLAAEAPLSARLAGGEVGYHAVFGRITQSIPVLLMAATGGTLLLVAYVASGRIVLTPVNLAFNIIIVAVNLLAFSTYLWEFVTINLGLRKLGGSFLQLASFSEDRYMGLRPSGGLALALAIAYFGALLLAYALLSTIIPSILGTAIFGVFALVGVGLFFLPLTRLHARMLAEKHRLSAEIDARYPRLANGPVPPPRENVTLDQLRHEMARLSDLKEIEMLERRIATLPTWPFDVRVGSQFVGIVLTIIGILIARVATDLLHF